MAGYPFRGSRSSRGMPNCRATAASFRDGPKDQTRNLEIPGSRFRAPRNDVRMCGKQESKRGQIWHGRGCCGIEKQAPRLSALLLILYPHHIFSAGDFFMRRSFILAGVAITLTMLVGLFAAAHAQQPMQRVQV